MTPRVTIVIPFYNCPYIANAVESALNQSYGNTEIIVVDDGSTMHAEAINPYRPYIHYLGKSNGGTGSALNHGIRHASGDYIAWLSSDDVFYPDKINNQVLFMQEHNSLVSFTNFNYINAQGQVVQYNAGAELASEKDLYRILLQGNPINGCTVMIRKDLLGAIGLFDEALLYTQDLDLWMRILVNGFRFLYLNESLTGYRWHEGMGTLRFREAIEAESAYTFARYRDILRQFI
ncbi:glycosyltransferase [Paenibacillus sp. BR2-3]|uniref:glycosyltransferase family 2 protein n=1 Tax=Paenibacillus sp. BR2-3 TaxID=3048494 RepID=UPI0039778003